MSCGLTSGTVGPARNLSSNTSSDDCTIKYQHGQRNGADYCERAHNSDACGETGTP